VAKKKGPSLRLGRQHIFEVAVEFADTHGIEKLNMRTLAKELDSPVMNLYTYVRNKDELLERMVDSVASEISTPEPITPWRDAISEMAASAKRSHYRHPWANRLWSTSASSAKMAHQESILRVLRQAGFSVQLACRGYHAVTIHTIGFALQALDFPRDSNSMKKAADNFLAQADATQTPYFVEHVKHHQQNPQSDGEFEFVLTMILDGLEKLLEAE
jgi:AcrR family transcriptional regulator